jgi:streptogramin lyase
MHSLRRFAVAAIAVLVLCGCSALRGALPAPDAGQPGSFSSAFARPGVLQGGESPRWALLKVPGENISLEGLAAGPDGAMWSADYVGAALWRVTMDGGYRRIQLQNFYPQSLVLGADGDFYMNSPSGYPAVAEVTPAGKMVVISLPAGEWSYGGMVVGPDKDVWFTEQLHLGRITAGGTVKQFSTPGNCGVAGSGITVGPDRDLWYTASCPFANGRVVKLDPFTGATRSWSIPSGEDCDPSGAQIVAAPDGDLWYPCGGGYGTIGRFTPHGKLMTYPIGSTAVIAMTIGPDGDIWYVDDLGVGSLLGRVDPENGHAVVYTPPPNESGREQSIAAGPDGNVWMAGGSAMEIYILRQLRVTPKTLSFSGTGQTDDISVTEQKTDAWTASSSNNGVASVSTTDDPHAFAVESIGKGSCTISVKDAVGNTCRVSVSVSGG